MEEIKLSSELEESLDFGAKTLLNILGKLFGIENTPENQEKARLLVDLMLASMLNNLAGVDVNVHIRKDDNK
ncbi:MAG: hypothetical protein GXX09_11775 [Syntrophomonadaceae bacterium]|nr:hypothetical protein [Syntrophomonadaceae bacterium]